MIRIIFDNKKINVHEEYIYYDLCKEYEKEYNKRILLLKINGNIKSLHTKVNDGDIVYPIFFDNKITNEAYVKTAIFILLKSLIDTLYKDEKINVSIDFTVGNGYYFNLNRNKKLTTDEFNLILSKFKYYINNKFIIKPLNYTNINAINYFKNKNMPDIYKLFTYTLNDNVTLYELDGYINYFNNTLLYDTSYIDKYSINKYKDGLILIVPDYRDIDTLPKFLKLNKIFKYQKDQIDWQNKLNCTTSSELNDLILNNKFNDLVNYQETYNEMKISKIINQFISTQKKLIFIGGPSSSGKTTFANRIKDHLSSIGLKPYLISVDNFFVDRDKMIPDEKGKLDFEALDAVDIELFNDFIISLLQNKETIMPIFDFIVGKKKFEENNMIFPNKNNIYIFEGIHCLNDKLTKYINKNDKFKIYISTLTHVNINKYNRFLPSDVRLLRRILRDKIKRGYDVATSIKNWEMVLTGEEKNIYPFQENCDVIFNSSFLYEISIMKKYVEPLLFSVEKDTVGYNHARRLLTCLSFYLSASSNIIPKSSLLEEFIGEYL